MTPRILTDLEALGIGVAAGVVSYFLSKAIDRIMSRRTSLKRKQALEQATAQLDLVDRLTSSDRATTLFGFKILCLLLAFVALAEFATHLLIFVEGGGLPSAAGSMFSGIVTILSGYFAFFFKELERPERTDPKVQVLPDARKG